MISKKPGTFWRTSATELHLPGVPGGSIISSPPQVVPVLNDDATKAAMLTPAQGLQLLGVLELSEGRDMFGWFQTRL